MGVRPIWAKLSLRLGAFLGYKGNNCAGKGSGPAASSLCPGIEFRQTLQELRREQPELRGNPIVRPKRLMGIHSVDNLLEACASEWGEWLPYAAPKKVLLAAKSDSILFPEG